LKSFILISKIIYTSPVMNERHIHYKGIISTESTTDLKENNQGFSFGWIAMYVLLKVN
jgi:hypothetical protein